MLLVASLRCLAISLAVMMPTSFLFFMTGNRLTRCSVMTLAAFSIDVSGVVVINSVDII